jgi:hypothetical protein
MSKSTINSNMHQIVNVDEKDEIVSIKAEYLPPVTQPVNADWDATSGLAEILNKPTIPDAQVNSDWNANTGVASILNRPNLSAVATSGSYNDLSNTPILGSAAFTSSTDYATASQGLLASNAISEITSLDGSVSISANGTIRDLSVVGSSGANLPDQTGNAGKFLSTDGTNPSWATVTVPTKVSDLDNDSGFITANEVPDGLPDQTGNDGKVLSTDGTTASWVDKCVPVLHNDTSRPISYVARGDLIIKLDYTTNTVPVKSKFVSTDIATDWPDRATKTYIPC